MGWGVGGGRGGGRQSCNSNACFSPFDIVRDVMRRLAVAVLDGARVRGNGGAASSTLHLTQLAVRTQQQADGCEVALHVLQGSQAL